MKLEFDVKDKRQPDPFVFEDHGKFYMYVTAFEGVEAYSAEDLFGKWTFEGIVCSVEGWKNYWAPCIIRYKEQYYLYFSCEKKGCPEWLHVAVADTPLGPFTNATLLYDRFTIDAHVVETEAGLFLWYAEDNVDCERMGTRVFLDRLIDPFTPAGLRKEVVLPSIDEEIYRKNRLGDGRNWYTIEGPFWFKEGDWQYLMYSGGCYQNDTYHIGYAAAKSNEEDLTLVDFKKFTRGGEFAPVLCKNEQEEGTGHHSVIRYKGDYYAVYHGRDIENTASKDYVERRTARICRLTVNDGEIIAERL